ncbi:threonine-phosphate decarboxylase [Neptuniibacter sp. PT8_73]|uniref:threonine-phosphate decarboxylase n=1 Tax=Neptuniibacter sp. PT8_73 TaxID=3398206 RepID=UPI0039F5D958
MSDLIHGGDLISASAQYGIPVEEWLDLSTGINPVPYPVPQVSEHCFQQLPYQSAEFKAAVKSYYGAEGVAANGTQQIIELLPSVLPSVSQELPILLPDCGYQEHRYSWQQQKRELNYYPATDQIASEQRIQQQLNSGSAMHLLLINPNNPTGIRFSPEQIYRWAEQMQQGAYLIVDEAFIDLSPEQSVLSDYDRFEQLGNILVLRSFGKFFGLAGIRLGFAFANQQILQKLQTELGPWAVNGPAQAVAIAALNDVKWQAEARQKIRQNAQATLELWQPLFRKLELGKLGFGKLDAELLSSDDLFLTAKLDAEKAKQIYQFLAEQGILIRLVLDEEFNCDLSGDKAQSDSKNCLLRSGLVDTQNADQCQKLKRVISELLLTLE